MLFVDKPALLKLYCWLLLSVRSLCTRIKCPAVDAVEQKKENCQGFEDGWVEDVWEDDVSNTEDEDDEDSGIK